MSLGLGPAFTRWRNDSLEPKEGTDDAVHLVVVRDVPIQKAELAHLPTRPLNPGGAASSVIEA